MLEDYLNQNLTWAAKSTLNDYGEQTYAAATTIKGRKEAQSKIIRNEQGEEVTINAVAYTDELVSIGDKVDGRIVVSLDALVDLDGDVMFYACGLI